MPAPMLRDATVLFLCVFGPFILVGASLVLWLLFKRVPLRDEDEEIAAYEPPYRDDDDPVTPLGVRYYAADSASPVNVRYHTVASPVTAAFRASYRDSPSASASAAYLPPSYTESNDEKTAALAFLARRAEDNRLAGRDYMVHLLCSRWPAPTVDVDEERAVRAIGTDAPLLYGDSDGEDLVEESALFPARESIWVIDDGTEEFDCDDTPAPQFLLTGSARPILRIVIPP